MYEMVLHELPAKMTDLICTLFGKEPFAVRLCNKMQKGMRSLEYFTTHEVTVEITEINILTVILSSGPGIAVILRSWLKVLVRRTNRYFTFSLTVWIGSLS